MKALILCFIFIMQLSICKAVSPKEEAFRKTVSGVIKAFADQDSLALSKFIHKKTGICLLFRNGVFDNLMPLNTIGFQDEQFPQVMFSSAKGIRTQNLQYGKLPKYSCDREGWNKKGLWVDTTHTDHMVSAICKMRNKLVPDHIAAKTISRYYTLEQKSRRVVLVGKNDLELVFYLSYLNGLWVLTIVDHVSSDCSA